MTGPQIRVWDIWIRLFHWAVVLLVAEQIATGELGWLNAHIAGGCAMLGLLLFRLMWGVVGSPTARFAGFVKGPSGVLAYLRGQAAAVAGHNPLGGWSILAMLTVLAGQIGLGLFSVDEEAVEAGPLSSWVSFDTGRAIAHLHHKLFWVLAGLIALHLAAIAFYALKRRNLVRPMITGVADPDPDAEPGALAPPLAPLWRMIPAALAAAGVAWFVAHGLKVM